MQAKNEILEELKMLNAHILPGIRQTPYRVQEGYFEGFATQVLRQLTPLSSLETSGASADLNTGLSSGFSTGASKSLAFSVPEGYFDNFAQNLLSKIKAGQTSDKGNSLSESLAGSESAAAEISRLSPIVNGISRLMPYQLPSDYFEGLSPILVVARQYQPFTIPEGYFEEISPILTVARQYPAYIVPARYFEQFPEEVNDQIAALEATSQQTFRSAESREQAADRQQAPVISLKSRKPARKWMRYAVAASVAGIILFTGAALEHRSSRILTQSQVASVDVASSLNSASDSEMQSYLDDQNNDQANTLTDAITNNSNNIEIDDNDLKSLLGNIPDGELKQYMEEHGGANDIATN